MPKSALAKSALANLEFISRGGQRVPKSFLKKAIATIGRELGKSDRLTVSARRKLAHVHSLQMVFVSKSEMKRLNRKFRGKNRPTDVLSFAPTEVGSLGELVFSLDVLKQQARDHDMKFHDELGYMVLHGVLHLLGYNHEASESAAKRMFRLQDKVFDAARRHW